MCLLLVALVAVWHTHHTTSPADLEADIDASLWSEPMFQTQQLADTCQLSTEGEKFVKDYEKKLRVMYRNKAESAAGFRSSLDIIIQRTDRNTEKYCILVELQNYLNYMITNQNLFRGRMRN